MFDPQTSGGILAAVPHMQTKHCLQRLHESSFSHATVVAGYLNNQGFCLKSKVVGMTAPIYNTDMATSSV